MMKFMKTRSIYQIIGIVGILSALVFPGMMTAQTPDSLTPESLQLPEVVITGVDRSKVQREIPKLEIDIIPPAIENAIRDEAALLIREGDVMFSRQLRQAEEHYSKARTIDPDNSDVYWRLGAVYRAQKKYIDAANAYEQGLTLFAQYPEAHYQLGLLYEQHLQDSQKALEHYQAYLDTGGVDLRVRIWIRNLERQLTGESPTG